VRWNNNKTDNITGSALLNYYSAMLVIYLNKAKDALFSDTNIYFKNVYDRDRLIKYYRDNYESFESAILGQFRIIVNTFDTTGTFDINDVLETFNMVYEIMCLSKIEYERTRHNNFPLTNINGYFSYNTYLYALLNDVVLIGFPFYIFELS
jgi:hypothetical protein